MKFEYVCVKYVRNRVGSSVLEMVAGDVRATPTPRGPGLWAPCRAQPYAGSGVRLIIQYTHEEQKSEGKISCLCVQDNNFLSFSFQSFLPLISQFLSLIESHHGDGSRTCSQTWLCNNRWPSICNPPHFLRNPSQRFVSQESHFPGQSLILSSSIRLSLIFSENMSTLIIHVIMPPSLMIIRIYA